MSLDVYLYSSGGAKSFQNRILIREDGRCKEISRAEWDKRFPGREPIELQAEITDDGGSVFWANITHNLGAMAKEAGLYEALWQPNMLARAADLIEPLRGGLARLKTNPDAFRRLNPENGWGTYEGLVEFVEEYLAACERWPDAEVRISS